MSLTKRRQPGAGVKGAASLTRPSEVHGFLSSMVWQEESGKSLTVRSLLAPQDLDLWVEASRLTPMPLTALAQSLADLIANQARRAGITIDAESAADRVRQSLPHAV